MGITSDSALPLAIGLFAMLIVSAYTDFARGKIYNWCTLPVIVIGLAGNYYLVGDLGGLMQSLLGLAVGAGLFLLPYWFGLMGAGDVKLMAAVGALGCFRFALHSAFLSAVVGAIFAVAILVWKGKLGPGLKNFGGAVFKPWTLKEKELVDDTRVPYGVAIAAGSFWAYFYQAGIFL